MAMAFCIGGASSFEALLAYIQTSKPQPSNKIPNTSLDLINNHPLFQGCLDSWQAHLRTCRRRASELAAGERIAYIRQRPFAMETVPCLAQLQSQERLFLLERSATVFFFENCCGNASVIQDSRAPGAPLRGDRGHPPCAVVPPGRPQGSLFHDQQCRCQFDPRIDCWRWRGSQPWHCHRNRRQRFKSAVDASHRRNRQPGFAADTRKRRSIDLTCRMNRADCG